MLAELSIKNFAIIETLTTSFKKGLTVLTGETGAGKSVIIDAIHLLVGGRGSTDFVRHGEDRAEIEGLFLIENGHPCFEKASQFGIEIEEGMVVLQRMVYKTGKNVCRVNGKLVTISTLREIGATLIDIHSQHEHQDLMNEQKHIHLLDQYGGQEIQYALLEYKNVYEEFEKTEHALKRLNQNEQEMVQRLDLLKFQWYEIHDAQLKMNEDVELEEEKRKLANFERLYESLQITYDSLRGDEKGLDWLSLAMNHIQEAAELDKNMESVSESIMNSYYILEDMVTTIRGHLDTMEYNPERLNEIEQRLNEIHRLKRKYGKTVEEILEYASKIEEEIEEIENRESHIEQLMKQKDSLEKDLQIEAENVSILRKKIAQTLTDSIHQELKELFMDKTVFEVRFQRNEHYKKDGADQIEFYLSTNPGEPLKPLSRVASGGELSRIMLALKSIFSRHQGVTSIIFDEVDTGVSGRVAQAIGEKIFKIAYHSQVICISHLPQVAAMADTHMHIDKIIEGDRTKTEIIELNEANRVKEIARMISGAEITEVTENHAKEMIEMADKIKFAYK